MVAPERRGHALAVVLAGLSAATALGAPIGTLVGSVADWRMTLWAVALLGMLAGAGVFSALPNIPASTPLGLRERLAPLADIRVAVTLLTTVLVLFGPFLLYTYISVVFDRATGGSGAVLAVLMSLWGLGATVGSLRAGALTDRLGNRVVINVAIAVCALDFALMPWTSASFTGAGLALAVWGVCGWGFYMAQQHRLVSIAPTLAPVVLALNASVLYFAISVSSVAGALALSVWDPHKLPWLGAALIVVGIAGAETAHRLIRNGRPRAPTTLRPQPVRR
jgi:predicted MFS family arabinose efflux permease